MADQTFDPLAAVLIAGRENPGALHTLDGFARARMTPEQYREARQASVDAKRAVAERAEQLMTGKPKEADVAAKPTRKATADKIREEVAAKYAGTSPAVLQAWIDGLMQVATADDAADDINVDEDDDFDWAA